LAQAPNATRIFDFARRTFAMCSCSLFRTEPLKKVTSTYPSGNASTSLYLMSMATGQNTMSACSASSRTFSFVSRTAISQPPQLAAQ